MLISRYSVFLLLIPFFVGSKSLSAQNSGVSFVEWGHVTERAYRLTIPVNIGRTSVRGVAPLYSESFWEELLYSALQWENAIYPDIRYMVDHSAYLNQHEIGQLIKDLKKLSTQINEYNMGKRPKTTKTDLDKWVKEAKAKGKILQKELSGITEKAKWSALAFEHFAKLNEKASKVNFDAPDYKTKVQKSIDIFRGALNAIAQDLVRLNEKLQKLETTNEVIIDVSINEILKSWKNVYGIIQDFGAHKDEDLTYTLYYVSFENGQAYQITDSEWVLETSGKKERLKEQAEYRSNVNVSITDAAGNIYLIYPSTNSIYKYREGERPGDNNIYAKIKEVKY